MEINKCFSHIFHCVFLCAVILIFSSCAFQDNHYKHQPFVSVFDEMQTKHTNIELVDMYMYGYGEYDILYTSDNEDENQYQAMTALLYEFDQIINNSTEFASLLNGCYIKIKTSASNAWIAIQYRYDIDVQIHTNFSEDNISKIKDFFPYEKIIAFSLIDGSPVQLEY